MKKLFFILLTVFAIIFAGAAVKHIVNLTDAGKIDWKHGN